MVSQLFLTEYLIIAVTKGSEISSLHQHNVIFLWSFNLTYFLYSILVFRSSANQW